MIFPAIIIGDNVVNLSLVVDDATRMVTGWSLVNNSTQTAVVSLTEGAWSASQSFPPGSYSGSVPKNRQWNIDDETNNLRYDITMS